MDSEREPIPEFMSLEHSNLMGTYEELNKSFRAAQKDLDRDAARTTESASELERLLKGSAVTVTDLKPLVKEMQDRLVAMKEKLITGVAVEKSLTGVLKSKIVHIMEGGDEDEEKVQQFRRIRLERIIVDYMLRCGYYDTAMKVVERSNIAHLNNVSIFVRAKAVEESLAAHKTEACLEWCHENRSKLRRLKSTFELKVRQQTFIEYLRNNDQLQAVLYARKHFSKLDKENFQFILPTMALLAVGKHTKIDRYKSLWSTSRWKDLIEQFRSENIRLYNLGDYSPFSAVLQCGISTLKTPLCSDGKSKSSNNVCLAYADDNDNENENGNNDNNDNDNDSVTVVQHGTTKRAQQCPICMDEVQPLVDGLPIGRVNHSKLRCAYSGETLNENNPPLSLPNGMVYGQNSLLAIASENDGVIICPRTKERYTLKDAERVFVL